MSSMLSSLISASNTLTAFQRSIETVGNNVNNVSTPGYARQTQTLLSAPFQPEAGLAGGVLLGDLSSARDSYTEASVRHEQQAASRAEQLETSLARLEPVFSVSAEEGIPGALNRLFNAFSNLSASPNDGAARQNVIEQAGQFAQSVRQSALRLDQEAAGAGVNIKSTVDTINRLAGQLRDLNAKLQEDIRNTADPGLDAQVHATLEDLSQYTDIQTLRQDDGTFTVLMEGQTPLVMGVRQYGISADLSGSHARILDAAGDDVTAQVSGGRIGALLELRNTLLPEWTARLDGLAAFVADTVNGQLAAGIDQDGLPGAALFTYNSAHAAGTLETTGITRPELAAASLGAQGGNGNALLLAGLATSAQLDGSNAMGQYSSMASGFGARLQSVRSEQQTASDLLAQAHSMREVQSGVSLDEEAARLIGFQRSYEAAAKMIAVLDEITQACLSILR